MLTEFPLPDLAGPKVDPRGAHVVMRRMGRDMLGEVRSYYRGPHGWLLRVTFLNGEPWPVEPTIGAVQVLVRTYDDDSNNS